MLSKLVQTFRTVFRFLKFSWIRLILLFIVLTVVAIGINMLVPRVSSVFAGKGFDPEGSPYFKWSQISNKMLEKGFSAVKDVGTTNMFFTGLYGSIEFIIHNTLLSIIAGIYAFYVLGSISKNEFGLRSIRRSAKSVSGYTIGLWFIIIILMAAGGIGALEQIFYNSQAVSDTMSMLSAWTLAGSAAVITLCIIFVRLSPLPYVRCQSSEGFRDSIKYAFHLTSGNFWYIVITLTPFVVGSFLLFHYTRSIPYVGTITQQLGIVVVVVVEACLYDTMVNFREQAKTSTDTVRLG